VLALCEDGVPLHWSRRNHGDFPDSFRQKVGRAHGVDACADPFSFQWMILWQRGCVLQTYEGGNSNEKSDADESPNERGNQQHRQKS